NPGGNPANYATQCRSCHALMDGMGGAFARFDFVGNSLVWFGPNGVAPKMNKNGNVYPQGYLTLDDVWINMATQHHNQAFGWRGQVQGKGIKEFGSMLANAKKFGQCMTQRVFKEVCKRDPQPDDAGMISTLADDFEAGGYKLRALFQKVAVHPACLGT
ncbi:MAG TPA: DUF1585 domain-containing protein, partial [Bdellovibrionota bacterium]|nr:DUF1585 domain-containing protein [Bdellovibrionota bacterium]